MKKFNWTFLITWVMIFLLGFLFWKAIIKFTYESIL
jgi:cytochrome c oxidase assembly factor CtaG